MRRSIATRRVDTSDGAGRARGDGASVAVPTGTACARAVWTPVQVVDVAGAAARV